MVTSQPAEERVNLTIPDAFAFCPGDSYSDGYSPVRPLPRLREKVGRQDTKQTEEIPARGGHVPGLTWWPFLGTCFLPSAHYLPCDLHSLPSSPSYLS